MHPYQSVAYSFLVHFAILMFTIAYAMIRPPLDIKIAPHIRVDFVALPEDIKSAPEHLTSLSSKKKQSKAEKQRTFQKSKQAVAMLRALENLTESEEKITTLPPTFSGNKLSQGSQSLQNQDQKTSLDTRPYLHDLQVHIQEHWFLPVWLQNLSFSAQVRLFIASNGYLVHYEFIHPSGNTEFDALVKNALENSNPFPIPSPSTQEGADVLVHGVIIGFPL